MGCAGAGPDGMFISWVTGNPRMVDTALPEHVARSTADSVVGAACGAALQYEPLAPPAHHASQHHACSPYSCMRRATAVCGLQFHS